MAGAPASSGGLTQIVQIEDSDDPRIDVFRNVRDRDLSGRHGGFVAEGEVVLRALARSRLHRARSVLIAQHRADKLTGLLDSFDPNVSVYSAGQTVMDRITGFHIHRGILAFGERSLEAKAADLLGAVQGPATVLILFGVSNHDNVGGVFRNAAAFGAAAVVLDSRCCDPLYRKAIRVSVGATLLTPFAYLADDGDPLALCAEYEFEPLALSPGGTASLTELEPPSRAAVLIGSEGQGLPAGVLERARSISIPMDDGFDSLNLATTSGIVLHHLRHGRRDREAQ